MNKVELLTINEVCVLLRVSRTTVYTWNTKGVLKPIKLASRVRYLKSDIENLLNIELINKINTKKFNKIYQILSFILRTILRKVLYHYFLDNFNIIDFSTSLLKILYEQL